jgi:hypothetical protein
MDRASRSRHGLAFHHWGNRTTTNQQTEQGQPMNYESLKATAQSLQELCKELIADIDNGVLNPEAIHFYLHDLETGDNSIYSALELELEETEGN